MELQWNRSNYIYTIVKNYGTFIKFVKDMFNFWNCASDDNKSTTLKGNSSICLLQTLYTRNTHFISYFSHHRPIFNREMVLTMHTGRRHMQIQICEFLDIMRIYIHIYARSSRRAPDFEHCRTRGADLCLFVLRPLSRLQFMQGNDAWAKITTNEQDTTIEQDNDHFLGVAAATSNYMFLLFTFLRKYFKLQFFKIRGRRDRQMYSKKFLSKFKAIGQVEL